VLFRITRVRDADCADDLRGGGGRQAAGLPVHLRLPQSHIIRTRRPRYSRSLVQVRECVEFIDSSSVIWVRIPIALTPCCGSVTFCTDLDAYPDPRLCTSDYWIRIRNTGALTSFFKDKNHKEVRRRRNQDFSGVSYYFCSMMEGFGSVSGPILVTNGSGCGSWRPKNIRIRNTALALMSPCPDPYPLPVAIKLKGKFLF
jgi:hypothetical protein